MEFKRTHNSDASGHHCTGEDCVQCRQTAALLEELQAAEKKMRHNSRYGMSSITAPRLYRKECHQPIGLPFNVSTLLDTLAADCRDELAVDTGLSDSMIAILKQFRNGESDGGFDRDKLLIIDSTPTGKSDFTGYMLRHMQDRMHEVGHSPLFWPSDKYFLDMEWNPDLNVRLYYPKSDYSQMPFSALVKKSRPVDTIVAGTFTLVHNGNLHSSLPHVDARAMVGWFNQDQYDHHHRDEAKYQYRHLGMRFHKSYLECKRV